MSLSVLGCVVNGPGEARETDIGITGGGQGKHMVYLSGVTDHHVRDDEMIDHIVRLVEAKAAEIEAAEAPGGRRQPSHRRDAESSRPTRRATMNRARVQQPRSSRPSLVAHRRRSPATFSAMDAVMKGLVLAIGTFTTMFWRNLAGIGMAGAPLFAAPPRWPAPADDAHPPARGMLGSRQWRFLFFWGLARVPMAQAIALAFIAPLIALVSRRRAARRRRSARATVGGSLIAFAGVVVIFFGQAQADLGREALLGSLAILVSAVCYAINIILMRRQALAAEPARDRLLPEPDHVTVLLARASRSWAACRCRRPAHWPWLLLAAVLAIVLDAAACLGLCAGRGELSGDDRIYRFLWAALFGWMFFREPVSLFTLAGAALIVAGCILAARRRRASPGGGNPALEADRLARAQDVDRQRSTPRL